MLTVSVQNLGPIAEGTVDLKPLTIFVGPSNTGKSYMAAAVYALMKAFEGDSLVPPRRFFVGGATYTNKWPGGLWDMPEEDSAAGKAIWAWAKQLKETGSDPQDIAFASLPADVQAGLREVGLRELEKACVRTMDHLTQALGTPHEFVSYGAQPGDFQLALRRDQPRLNVDIPLPDEGKAGFDLDISRVEMDPSPLALLEYEPTENEEPVDIFYEVTSSWARSVERTVFSEVPLGSYYLPAARSGIVQGHKVLAAEIVRRAARMGQQGQIWNTLPGITTEFLGNVIGLDRRLASQGRSSELDKAVSFIQNEVLHGKIDLDESGELPMPEIVYMPTGAESGTGKFTLDRTSSMVQELAPLVLFLKYLVRPGDLLILEEPESHLHPAAQRRVAQGIVRLVNAGVKVIITTHSDIFLSQINNLMRINHASARWLREKGFDPRDRLSRYDVGAYQFAWNEQADRCVIKELEITDDVGIENEAFDDVIHALYEESVLVERIRIR